MLHYFRYGIVAVLIHFFNSSRSARACEIDFRSWKYWKCLNSTERSHKYVDEFRPICIYNSGRHEVIK